VLLALRRHDEAQRDANSAISITEKRFGPDSERLVPMLTALGNAYLGEGDAGRARDVLERANRLCQPATARLDRANARFSLARAIVATKGDRDRARQLAKDAEADYDGAGEAGERQAAATWRENTSRATD
jgi:hypothetical protein